MSQSAESTGITHVVEETGESFEEMGEARERLRELEMEQQTESVKTSLKEVGLDVGVLEETRGVPLSETISDAKEHSELSINHETEGRIVAAAVLSMYSRELQNDSFGSEE